MKLRKFQMSTFCVEVIMKFWSVYAQVTDLWSPVIDQFYANKPNMKKKGGKKAHGYRKCRSSKILLKDAYSTVLEINTHRS